MAMVFGGDHRAAELSEQAQKLYGAISGQDWALAATLQASDPNSRQELVTWGFISDEEPPVARDPQQVLRDMVSRELAAASRHIALVSTMPELSRDMIREYRQGQLRAGTSSVYLADQDTVNRRLQDVIGDARREILAAQPGGPRKREVLKTAITRDGAALDRGVELRTIYRDTVRDHALTAEYARTMSTRTGGRPAQYRTLVADFERMVIVDRETAVLSDHIVEGGPENAAWLVTDPAVVTVLARMFDANWRRAQPWTGELRPSRRSDVRNAGTAGDGVRTDRRQRGILRYLCGGESQDVTARKMGVSRRKLQGEIAVLKELWGVRTLAELTYQYGSSPDRLVDDTDPAADVTTGPAG
ncbi:hypothetical protein [Streptomyces sp. NPDC008092]|uniref:hypothetical protein n=1 Tax=Streptomyces sp. NPDC008092 TaxID=3364808 RepID=UPI0036E91B1E